MMKSLLMAVLLLVPAGASGAEPLRLLVAFGINEGLPAEVTLRYAENDARTFADLLTRTGEVEPANTEVLTGQDGPALTAALENAARKAKAHGDDVVLFFYFSGHGDADNLHIGPNRYSMKELDAHLAQIPARLRVAVIDACRGKSDVSAKGFVRVSPFSVNLDAPKGISGVVTLRSSSEGEQSQESRNLGGAVFTHYLLTALRGAGDRDFQLPIPKQVFGTREEVAHVSDSHEATDAITNLLHSEYVGSF